MNDRPTPAVPAWPIRPTPDVAARFSALPDLRQRVQSHDSDQDAPESVSVDSSKDLMHASPYLYVG